MPRYLAMTPSTASPVQMYSQYSARQLTLAKEPRRARRQFCTTIYVEKPATSTDTVAAAPALRRRALRCSVKPYLSHCDSSEYAAPRTRSVSEADTEDGESDRNSRGVVSRRELCETFDFESEAFATSPYRLAANRTMLYELVDLFHSAKECGCVVEVGPTELDTNWETFEISAGGPCARSVRCWASALRSHIVPQFLSFAATFC